MANTYSSKTNLGLPSIASYNITDPAARQAFNELYNAMGILLSKVDSDAEELAVDLPLNESETAMLVEQNGTVTVDGAVTVTQAGTVNVNIAGQDAAVEVTGTVAVEQPVNVTPTDTVDVNIVSPLETTESGKTGVPVFVQDQYTDLFAVEFLNETFSGITLNAATVIDAFTVELATGHGLTDANAAGHTIRLFDSADVRYFRAKILSISGDVVTIDSQISAVFPVATTSITVGNSNIIADPATDVETDGSTTPILFALAPSAGQVIDVTQIVVVITSDELIDLRGFGGGTALTRGLVLRKLHSDGTYSIIGNFKTNGDITLLGFNHVISLAKTGNTVNSFVAKMSFAGQPNFGVTLRLDGDNNERLELMVNDALTLGAGGNLSMRMIAEGSFVQ